jgi:chemotaxis protein MotA
MDLATVAGVLSAFGLVLAAIVMGGGMESFIDVPSMLIVMGGTVGATLINFPLKNVLGVVKVVKNAFFAKAVSVPDVIGKFVEFATKARREGILALESSMNEVDDKFLAKGLQLTIDGLEPKSIEEILETEIDHVRSRHSLGADILMTMGTFAPALGMIGTLIGLVQMLQNMSDPSKIGPAMAVALLTTFYGAVMANILFNPLAGKLRNRSKEEILVKELMLNGILAIARGDNPRIIEQKLHSFIPPDLRKSVFQ